MIVTCKASDIIAAVKTAAHVVNTQGVLPILACMKLEASGSTLLCTATDLEVAVLCALEAQVAESGAIAVPAKLFADFVATLPPREEILITASQNVLSLKAGSDKAVLKGQDALEFPAFHLDTNEWQEIAMIDAQVLKTMIKTVSFAAAKDKTRPIFSCLYLHAQQERGALSAVAADSFRMSHTYLELKEDTPQTSLLIDSRAFTDLVSLLPDSGLVHVLLQNSGNQVRLSMPHLDLVCRLVAGTYPEYTQIGKIEPTCYATAQASALADALRTSLLFIEDNENKCATCTLTSSGSDSVDGVIIIEAYKADVGDYTQHVPAQIQGNTLAFRVNAKYMLDALRAIKTESVLISAASAKDAVVLEPVGDSQTRHVIMPLVGKSEAQVTPEPVTQGSAA